MAGGNEVGRYILPIMPSIEGIGPNIDRKLGKAFAGVSKQASKALSDGVADGVKAAEAAVKKSSDAITKLRDKEADATGKLRVAEERLQEIREKGSKGSQLARAEEAREKALRGQASATRQVENETRSLTRAQKALTDAQNMKPPKFASGRDFLSGIEDQMDGVTSRFNGIGKGAGGAFVIGAVAAIGAGALLEAGQKAAGLVMDGFESIISTGMDFSKTMNNFQGVTRASDADMRKMSEAARALGSDVNLAGASASGAALGMTELAKAGFTIDEAITAARGTMQLATAGQIDSAQAAEIQANAMNAFGLSAESAAHTADLLANAAIASSADIPDLAQALQQVGGVAHGFGADLDSTIAALGMFANAGIKGSDAGTLLKTTMQSITDQGNPAQGAIANLGLELYKLNGQGGKQFVGFRELFRQLDEAKKRLNDPETFQAQTNVLFGSDAMRAAMLGTVADFDSMATKLERVGAAGEMAEAQMQGLPGAAEAWANTLESVQLSAFESLGPSMTTGLNAFVGFVGEHRGEIVGFFTEVADSAIAMGQVVLKSSGLLLEGFGQIAGGLGNVLGGMLKTGSFLQRAFGDSDTADQWLAEAEAMYGWGESMQDLGSELKNIDLDELRDGLRQTGEDAVKASDFVSQLGGNVKLLPDGKTIVLKDNSPEAIANIDKAKFAIEQIPGTTDWQLIAKTEQATAEADAWRRQQSGTPVDVTIAPKLDPAAAKAEFDRVFGPIMRGATPSAPAPAPGGNALAPGFFLPPPAPRAKGGIDSIGSTAHIGSPEYPNGLVRYREPSTGGEAYIPLKGGDRSVDIWKETGRRLGVWSFETGGFSPDVMAAEALAGTGYSQGSRTDCSGMVARVINRAMGLPDSGLMSTKNAAQWLAERGFQPGAGGPGTISVGWYDRGPNPNDGHMAMTLSNGMNAEAGGKNGVFTVGAGATGADDPKFDQRMFLPVQGMYGEGAGSAGGVAGGYSMGGGGGVPAGSTPGIDPTTGESGYFTPDARKVRDADQKVADADARVRRAETRQSELKADARESQKLAAQDELDKAKREAEDARMDRDEARKGKFTKFRGGSGGVNGQGGGETDAIGGIAGSFFKETFGLDGSMFPDISQLGVVKLANAIMGIGFEPQQGGFPWQTGYGNGNGTPWSGSPFAQAGAPGAGGGGTSGFPFGMIPNAIDAAGYARAGMAPPGTPASGVGAGPAPGPAGQYDMSRTINVTASPGMEAIGNEVRKQTSNVERLHTYMPKGV